ncbi:SET domain-containing protein [Candidatus Woesearchaeota archaeon]|nr:SET domain-containing protein [Candidatus Woesearchaeota archaeon]
MMADVLIKDSGKKGKGVFASRDFKQGELILTIDTSATIHKDNLQYLPLEEQNHTMYIGKKKYTVMKSPERYVNHSCKPNAYLKDYALFSKRAIRKGEEITCDYSLSSVDPWEMECNCKSKLCRHLIRGNLLQTDAAFLKINRKYIPKWLLAEVE